MAKQSGLQVSFMKLEDYFNITIKSIDYDIFSDPFSICCEDFICSTEHELAVLSQQPACRHMHMVHKCVDEPSAVEFQHKNKCLEDHYEVMDFKYRDVDVGLGSAGPHDGDTFKENIYTDKKHTEIVWSCSEFTDGNPYWKKRIGIQSKAKNNVFVQVGQKDMSKPQVRFNPGSDDVSGSAHFSQSSMISLKFIFSFCLIAFCIGSCWGATPIKPTQKLPNSCLKKMAYEQYDCPDFENMNEIGTDFQNMYLELNNTCCAGFTQGYDFHCQEVSIDGVSHSMFGCMKSEWVPSDCTGRIQNYNTFVPYFEVRKLPPTHYHKEGRYSYLVRFPENAPEKSKCTDYGMEKFCHSFDSNNMCTCRKGFVPDHGKRFAFKDDMVEYCRKCLQGLCPARHFPPDYTGPDMDCNEIDLTSDLYNFTCEQCPVILTNSTDNSTEQPEHLNITSFSGTVDTHTDRSIDSWRIPYLLCLIVFFTVILVMTRYWDSIKEKVRSVYPRGYNFIQQQPDNTV